MKRILLTGSRGFFGTRFIRAWGREFDIIATNSDTLDISSKPDVEKLIFSIKPDIVLHAAAIADTAFCNSNPEYSYRVNVVGTSNLADAVQETGGRMVFLSTEQVFNGNKESGPYSEESVPVPDTEYGRNKLESENYIAGICSDYLILRCTWMFDIPSETMPVSANILWDTIQRVMKGVPFTVPANEYRGLTYIDDLLKQFDKVIELPSGIYHTGSENSLDRYDVVCRIFNELGISERIPELIIKDNEKYRERSRDVRLDTSLIRRFGIEFPDSSEAISRCIRENHPGMI